ncbi:MAG: GTPase ObgE [Deltaproteobacteria bacterium]|nr:MAG: GTPase ObgE [Deltaproteobacteria bacterium]
MKFVDKARIFVKGGKGGDGCISFLRERFRPRGGPDGGNGGDGGNVLIRADKQKETLYDFKFKQHFKAKNGQPGKGKNQTGKKGEDLVIHVPVGTVVTDNATGDILADLIFHSQEIVVAKGGRGGRGNASFATSVRKAPRIKETGKPGEERWLNLEIKLIADIGIIGLPNVGKSTFISRISSAHPKIGDYPFTTLTPSLGVANLDDDNIFVIADIPGIVKDAHKGKGLGLNFLRHIERTSFLLHIIDLAAPPPRDPISDFNIINQELSNYKKEVGLKPQIVVLNKIDLPYAKQRLKDVKERFKGIDIDVFPISAITGEGIPLLLKELTNRISFFKLKKRNESFI